MFLLVLFCTPSVSNRSWLLSVSFQQLVLHTPVNLYRKREREGGRLSIEKDINLRRERERVNGCLVFFLVLFCTPSVSNRSWLLSVSFQQLVLHTPVNLYRKREREGGRLSIEKDINLRRERERVNGCLVFLLVLFCTPSVSNRSWLLSVSFQQLVLHTPVNLYRKREREGGRLSIKKDINLRSESERMAALCFFLFYSVLLQSVTGHGSYIKNVTRYRKH